MKYFFILKIKITLGFKATRYGKIISDSSDTLELELSAEWKNPS